MGILIREQHWTQAEKVIFWLERREYEHPALKVTISLGRKLIQDKMRFTHQSEIIS